MDERGVSFFIKIFCLFSVVILVKKLHDLRYTFSVPTTRHFLFCLRDVFRCLDLHCYNMTK